jgi:hypothetical protein
VQNGQTLVHLKKPKRREVTRTARRDSRRSNSRSPHAAQGAAPDDHSASSVCLSRMMSIGCR